MTIVEIQHINRNRIQFVFFVLFFILSVYLIYESYDVDSLAHKKERMLNRGATEGVSPESDFVVFYILLAPLFLFQSIWLFFTPYVKFDGVVLSVFHNPRKVRHFKTENISNVDFHDRYATISHKKGYKSRVYYVYLSKVEKAKLIELLNKL